MRGKGRSSVSGRSPYGITPAYAGKSRRPRKRYCSRWDHPRLCGEKHTGCRSSHFESGSPPPMRGKAKSRKNSSTSIRITPAYAGKSLARLSQRSNVWDHPRLCGEKISSRNPRCNGSGSPPPMRGKVLSLAESEYQDRITPAYAGKSSRFDDRLAVCRDHPRLCGEKGLIEILENGELGSPPPMRGKEPVKIC